MTVIKPIPDNRFHDYDDEMLINFLNSWREQYNEGLIHPRVYKRLLDDTYAVLGYRAALEYIEKYSSDPA